jgi:hypothetical protein
VWHRDVHAQVGTSGTFNGNVGWRPPTFLLQKALRLTTVTPGRRLAASEWQAGYCTIGSTLPLPGPPGPRPGNPASGPLGLAALERHNTLQSTLVPRMHLSSWCYARKVLPRLRASLRSRSDSREQHTSVYRVGPSCSRHRPEGRLHVTLIRLARIFHVVRLPAIPF